jgi:hypothetical protein
MKNYGKHVAILLASAIYSAATIAQELTPRAYWPTPVGTKILVTGYSYSEGDVLFDPSTPLFEVDSTINLGLIAYLQALDLWDRSSSIMVELPYSSGSMEGMILDIPANADFSGVGDLGVTLNVNLMGAAAMTVEAFQAFRANPRPVLGISWKVLAPTGRYEEDQLINVGGNRWATKAEIGAAVPFASSWMMELAAGVWFYGSNDDFLVGKLEQDPIYSAKANLIKRIRPGLWASLDITYFEGGRQSIDGTRLQDKQENVKVGATVVIPFGGRHAVKLGYAEGAKTKFGSDFDQWLITYQALLP